ncbi:MAG: hypothetical protein F6K30_02585 [Cyanothece sp. SIO2G6]|nr:hypothetical protein [Cyanothece sp. SIO2G6]
MPRQKWLEPLLDQTFIPQLMPLSPDDLKTAQAIAHELRQHWNELGFTQITQHKDLMRRTRKHLATALPDNHVAFDAIRLTPDEYAQANQVASKRVQQRNQTQTIVSPQDVNAIVTGATRVIGDNHSEWPDLAAALALLTGRRLTELFTATLEPANTYSVRVSGLAKRPDDEAPLTIVIPVLCQANYVLSALDRLRKATQAETLDHTTIDKKIGPKVLAATRKLFQKYLTTDLTTHVLRDLYGAIATYFYCPPNTSSHEFQAHCLAHYQPTRRGEAKLRAIAANRNYDRFSIQEDGIIRKGIRLSRPDVDVIPDFQTHNTETNTALPLPNDLTPYPLIHAFQAYELAQQRGWKQSKTTLLDHAKKRPGHVAQELGLCYDASIQRKHGDNRTPTWRDLWDESSTEEVDMVNEDTTNQSSPDMTVNKGTAGASAPIDNSRPDPATPAAQETATMTLTLLDRIQQLTADNTRLQIDMAQLAQQPVTPIDPSLLAELEQLRRDNQALRQQNEALKTALSFQPTTPAQAVDTPADTVATVPLETAQDSADECPIIDPIYRAIHAIFDWNNTPGRQHRQKWPISFPIIMELLRANGYSASQKAIKSWFERLESEIAHHYQLHGLSKTQSRFHQDRITDCIHLN